MSDSKAEAIERLSNAAADYETYYAGNIVGGRIVRSTDLRTLLSALSAAEREIEQLTEHIAAKHEFALAVEREIEGLKAIVTMLGDELDDPGREHSIFLKDTFSGHWGPGDGRTVQLSAALKRAVRASLAGEENL